MIDKIKSFGKNTIIYGFGNVLNRLLGFVLIPLYNNYIPVSDFGILAILEIGIVFLTILLGFGISAGHQRYFYIEKEKNTYNIFLFNTFFGNLFLSLISILPLLIYSESITSLLQMDISQNSNFQIAIWIVLIEILYLIPMQILQYENKPWTFLSMNFLKLVFSFIAIYYFVKFQSLGINGIMYGRLIGSLIIGAITILFIVLPRCKFKLRLDLLWQSIRFGLPVVLSNIAFTIFIINDRYMLKLLSTDAETGKYSFGYKIANFINLIFVQSIGTSFMPSIFSSEKEKDNTSYFRKMLIYYCIMMSVFLLSFLFFYQNILNLVVTNVDYQAGLAIVPVLSLFFMVMGMNYFACIGLFLKNKTHLYIIPSVITLIINILLNYLLIPRYGMMGAAVSTLIAQIANTAVLSYISNRIMKIEFEWGKVILIYLFLIVFYIFGNSIQMNILLNIFFKVSLLGVFLILIYKMRIISKTEIEIMLTELKKYIKK